MTDTPDDGWTRTRLYNAERDASTALGRAQAEYNRAHEALAQFDAANTAATRRGRLSTQPCAQCKKYEVYVTQDSDDDADYTIHCYACGHNYREDGPDA